MWKRVVLSFFVSLILALPLSAAAVTTPEDGDWSLQHVTLYNTPEAQIMTRAGDIDNLGFGWPDGFNPFSGATTPGHAFPWAVDPGDASGTDRIMVITSYVGTPPAGQDGYTGTTSRPENSVRPIDLDFDLNGVAVQSAMLQIFVDDFQAPVWQASYQVELDDIRINGLEDIINLLAQTGPVGKMISFQIPASQLHLLEDGHLSIVFDDNITGAGDGYAIDFVKLLINPQSVSQTGTVQGLVVDQNDQQPLENARVSAGGVVETFTDGQGNYTLTNVPAGLAVLTASKAGYANQDKSVDLAAGATANLNFSLEKELDPPTDLTAQSSLNEIGLNWTPSPSAMLAGYNVYRSESETGPWTIINTNVVTGDYYADSQGLTPMVRYYYYVVSVDADGLESNPSNIASAVFGLLKLFIPDANGPNGEQVRVPVNIANANGIEMCAVDIFVTFDPNVIQAADIEKSPLTAEYGWAKNLNTPGVVRAVIATATSGPALFGEGSLFYILFNVVGNTNDTSNMQFDVNATAFYDCRDLFNGLSLDLTDIGVFTVESAFILGDVNGDGVVDSADAALAMQIAVDLVVPTAQQLQAGDVNGDGMIRSNDVALIMRIAAGLPLSPEAADERMLRTSIFAAGDNVTVSLPTNFPLEPGKSAWVPVNVNDTAGIMGVELFINYDPNLVDVNGVRKTSLTQDFNLEYNKTAQAGQLRISLSATTGNGLGAGSGRLLEIQFTAKAQADDLTTSLILAGVRFNDTYSRDFAKSSLQKTIQLIDGSLKINQKSVGSTNVGVMMLLEDD